MKENKIIENIIKTGKAYYYLIKKNNNNNIKYKYT